MLGTVAGEGTAVESGFGTASVGVEGTAGREHRGILSGLVVAKGAVVHRQFTAFVLKGTGSIPGLVAGEGTVGDGHSCILINIQGTAVAGQVAGESTI